MLGLPVLDARRWGPPLRFSAPTRLVEEFASEMLPQLGAFTLYGSGDFHHLSGLWLRRVAEPVHLISFDNHPDWDVRPPRWGCGGWINRALELPQVRQASVWGCGNFEVWWPGQFFGNRRAETAGKIDLHIWVDQRPAKQQGRRGAMRAENWRAQFEAFVRQLAGAAIYVTIDLDCLRVGEAVTNWENGRFSVEDVAWALEQLRGAARIVGGDVCGAHSPPKYARLKQRFVSELDHPKIAQPLLERAAEINRAALTRLWPLLAD